MYTDPQILDDTTLSLDMNAGHHYFMHWYHHDTDTVVHWTRYDIIHWPLFLHVLSQRYYTDYCYAYMFHWYTDIPMHGLPHFILLISSLHGCSIHNYLMFTQHCDICSPHECTCMYCFYLLVIWITVHITCVIVPCYPCLPIIWLCPVTAIVIPVTGYISCWYAMCGIPHLLFPDSRCRVLCYQPSSCYVIVLHVPCTVLVPDILYSER